jgi:hypothetical protein
MEKNVGIIEARWYRPKEAQRLLGCRNTKFYEILGDGRLLTRKVDGMRLIWGPSIQNIGEEAIEPKARALS